MLPSLVGRGADTMILRRLADAIHEQNWFTVVLEVMIVVFFLCRPCINVKN